MDGRKFILAKGEEAWLWEGPTITCTQLCSDITSFFPCTDVDSCYS